MFIDDYTPMKRVGIEELEGACRVFQHRASEAEGRKKHMLEGAWLALHMMLVGRYRYPAEFADVFEMKAGETGGDDES